ncbi:MAG: GWxTD domain-containing protein [Thermoanaerobaculia bacterium]
MKKTMIVLASLALSAVALAQLSKHKDWAKSPEAYFLTPAERQEWGQIQNDADAEKFIAAYWAKRDPNPATANNEFRDEVNRRIAAADEQFKMRRQRGAESARGRLLVVLGAPSRFSQQRAQEADQTPSGVTAPALGTGLNAEQQVTVTWTYDKNKFDPSWDVGEVRARVLVDPQGGFDSLQTAGPVDRAIAKVAEKTIVNPSGQVGTAAAPGAPPASPPASTAPAEPAAPPRPATSTAPAVPPAGTGAPAMAAPAPSAAGAPPVAAALPAATKSALEAILQTKRADDAAFWGGTFRSIPGEPFYAFQLYVAAEKATAVAGGVKLGAVVQNASGQEVATLWEDATLSEMKTGSRTDRVYEKSIVLPPGEYRGSFALFPAAGGEPITASAAQFTVAQPTGFDVSPLILGNTLTPLTRRPAPTDPFVFGAEKPIRVEPKANRQFTREDGLWYFYTVSNPTVAAADAPAAPPATAAPSTPSAASPAPSTTPGAAASAPSLPAQTAKPRIQTRISVMRDGKAAFAPFTGPAEMQPLGSGYYASGSEIPLATFEPGHYTFAILVRDLNAPRDSAANKGVERKEDFIVLLPDGKVPEKVAAAPAAGKPTPRKP